MVNKHEKKKQVQGDYKSRTVTKNGSVIGKLKRISLTYKIRRQEKKKETF